MTDRESAPSRSPLPSRRKPGLREREAILNAVTDPFPEKTDKILRGVYPERGRRVQNENKGVTTNYSNMKKNKIIFFGILIVVVIVLAVWVGILIAGMQSGSNPDSASPYSAVYLSTGDIYFGKLSWFPSPHMTDVWLITRSQDQSGQAQTSLIPFKSVLWGPMDEISFNSQDIVFSTRLKNGSQIVSAMENPSSATSGQNGTAGTPTTNNGAPTNASTTAPSSEGAPAATSTK
jgi:hypothetical protein